MMVAMALHDKGRAPSNPSPPEDTRVTTLSEALTGYLAHSGLMESAGAPYAQQELHRFGRSLGWERAVDQLAPPEVATYAEGVVAAGGDIQGRLSPIKDFLTYLKKRGLSSHSLAPHVKIPRAAARSAPTASASSEVIQITADGHAAMLDELDELKSQRGSISQTIGTARADGDVSDNAPLDAAREAQVNAEGRIRELEEMLRRTVVLDAHATPAKGGAIRIGSKVVLHDEESGKDIAYTLVDTAEADPTAGKISIASPIGKAIMGHKQGQPVVVHAPKGDRRYRVKSIDS